MTVPPYNPQIPEKETNIPTAQTEFLRNFRGIFNAFSMNHVPLNDPTNPGNHSIVEMVGQKNSKSTLNQEIIIYSKKVANQTEQLFMRYQSNGKEFQLTEYQIYSVEPTIFQSSYFTFLPGGLVIQFGKLFSSGFTDFNISVIPPVSKNITGVNLGGADVVGVIFPPPPNVSLNVPVDGVFRSINLKSLSGMSNQFYLFVGNL